MTTRIVALFAAALAIGACELAAKIDRSKIPTEQTVASAGGSGGTGATGTAGSAQGGLGGEGGSIPQTCNDMRMNGDETDVDCGGSCAPAQTCENGMGCDIASDCTSLFCNNMACAPCAMQADCADATGTYCDTATMVCTPTKSNGTMCADDFECTDGFCVEDYMVTPGMGVCCNSACDMDCEACNLTGTVGTCTCITAGNPEMDCNGMETCMGCGMCG